MTTTSEILHAHATKDLGLKETPGPKSTPRIRLAIEAAARWLPNDDSQTAWCGCIRGLWGMETGTGCPPAHYRAAAWLTWGTPVPSLRQALQGDTVILSRPGGNHVALLDRYSRDGKTVWLLGGNQSDSVSIAKFSAALIKGIRR